MSKKITILLPAYNEEKSFDRLKECMKRLQEITPSTYEWEFLLVNDGSTDNTLQQMIKLHHEDPTHWNYLDLSRNYGKEIAMMAGFDYVTGDAMITMDTDMQHPIDVIPEMLYWWEQGYDDVYAKREQSKETWFKRKTSQWYYKILQGLTNIPIQKDTGDFRLLDRSCIEALKSMREIQRNTKGMYSWIGFRKKGITYKQLERMEGETKWSTMALVNLAMNGILSYTTAPLQFVSIMGITVSLAAFFYLVYILVSTLLYGDPVAGYPTIMVTVLFLGGLNLIGMGIIGEYLGKVFNEVKGRPGYFVRTYNDGKTTKQHTDEEIS